VGGGDSDVLEGYLCMSVRSVIVSEYRERSLNRYASSIQRDQDHRLPLMRRSIRVRHAHQNADLTACVAGSGYPPLTSVDDVRITLSRDLSSNIRRIG